jgi:hypothetical protein
MSIRPSALAALLLGFALSGFLSAQATQQTGADAAPRDEVPTGSPEPLTIAALASGAALAGGAYYRRRRRSS